VNDEKRIKELKLARLEVVKQQKQYREENKIEFFDSKFMSPNPVQRELLEAWTEPQHKVFTYTGANRIGKTTIGTIIGFSTLFGKWLWNDTRLHFPHSKPRKVRYIGQDWEKHIKAVVIPALKVWWPKTRPVHISKNTQSVEYFWTDELTGSTLEIMSNKQESELHEGWDGDLIIYDEPPTRKIRVANARGLIDRQGRELFCMTLLKEAWVDREVIKARNEDGSVDTSVFNVHGDIYSNVGYGITQEGISQFEKTLTEDEKEARLLGIPSYMSGLVYPTFSRRFKPRGHLKRRFKVPLSWIVDIAIDVHPREKQAVLFIATDPRNERYVVDEIWGHGDGTWVGEEIIRFITRNSYRVGRIVVDPLSKGDQNEPNTTFDKIDAVLSRYGYVLNVASKDKVAGILAVKDHLVGPNKEPSMWFFDDLNRTLYEIEGYIYDEDSQKPQDKDDHMMENLYRALLLDTQWYPQELGEDEEEFQRPAVNAITGY